MRRLFGLLLLLFLLFLGGAERAGAQQFCAGNIRCWSAASRPASPLPGTFGYNTDTKIVEFYNGSSWQTASVDGVVNVKLFGAVGDDVHDDTASINNAIAFARTLGPVSTLSPVKILFPPGMYLVTDSINLTNWSQQSAPANQDGYAVTVEGYGAYIHASNFFAGGHPVLDLLGSSQMRIRGISVFGNNSNHAFEASTGIQIGPLVAGFTAGQFIFEDVYVAGNYRLAAFYNLASEQNTYINFIAFNADPNGNNGMGVADTGSYVVVFDGDNHFNITSPFVTQTIAVGTHLSFTANTWIEGAMQVQAGSVAVPFFVSDAQTLTMKNTYMNTLANHCVELNVDSANSNLMGTMELNIHCENQSGANNINTMFLFRGAVANPIVRGFRHWDPALFAKVSLFGIDGTSSITSVAIHGIDENIASFTVGGSKFFDAPSKYTVFGNVTTATNAAWNAPNVFGGTLCLTGSGGYCNYTSVGLASNGPNNGFRTRSTADGGSNDFALYSKSGPQGFPAAILQGYGTAGQTAGKLGILTVAAGGSGYNGGGTGTFTNCTLTGGTGSGGIATVVLAAGVVTSATVTTNGTLYVIGDSLSINNACTGGSGSGAQITVTNYSSQTAFDILPLGVQAGNENQNGVTWFDVCNQDIQNLTITAFSCLHPAIFINGDVSVASSTFGTAARRRLMFGDTVAGYKNWIYANDDFHTLQGNVRGSGTVLASGIAQEDASKNLLLQSNNWAATWALTNATQGASALEDPWGTTTATLLTSTANGGNTTQAITVPNDSQVYAISVYVNSTSNPGAGFFQVDATFSGGTGFTSSIVFIPGTSIIGTANIAPNGCLNNDGGTVQTGQSALPATACYGWEKVVVGCAAAAGCTDTGETWYRVWFTRANNSTGNTTLTIKITPASGTTGTAIIAGAQVEPRTQVTPYIPTTVAAVQRQPGPIATKTFFTSGNSTNLAATATQYYAVGCEAATQICQGVFPSSGLIRNLYMTVQTAPGAGQNNAWTIMAGTGAAPGATTITCTISGGAATTCNDTTHTARVVAGDTFNVRGVASATATGTGFVTFGFELWTP